MFRPLSVPLPPLPFRDIPESRGAGGGAGLRPAVGRLEGGAGGMGLERPPMAPLAFAAAGGGGGGVGRITGAAGGGGASSLR